nr:hypothetical protein [Tanacetum cinerariifolium]
MSIEIRKKEKLLQEEQWAYLSSHPSKRLTSFCFDDDEDADYTSAITPDEPILSTEEPDNSLSMGDEHLDTISATESNEFIKYGVKNLIPIPSESEGIPEHVCDVPFLDNSLPLDVSKDTIEDLSESNEEFSSTDDDSFSFDKIDYVEASPLDSELVNSEVMEIVIPDDHSCSDEDVLEKIISKPLSEEEIIPMKSLRIHDSSLSISSKIDSLLDEFTGELTLLKSIPPGIDETDCDFEENIRLIEKLLYDNSSPCPSKEFISANSDAAIKSFSPSPILVKDSDSLMEEIDLFNSYVYDPNPNSFDCPPDSYNHPHPTYETYSYDSYGNDSQFGYDCQPHNLKYRDEIKITELKENFNGMSIEIRKKEKLLQEEQWAYLSSHPSKRLTSFCFDDDEDADYTSAITPDEPILSTEEPDNSLSMGDEHLDTISATESNEFIKYGVKNLIPIPSESEGIPEHVCDVPFLDNSLPLDVSKDTIEDLSESNEEFSSTDDDSFSFDKIDYVEASPLDSELVNSEVMEIVIPDDHSCSDEDVLEKIISKPLSEEEIIPMKSLRIHDSSLSISSKIDSLLDEFTGELTLLKSIPPGIDETDCDFEENIRLIEKLLYDNSSPCPSKEFISANSDAAIKSFSPSPILVKDSDSLMEEIDLFNSYVYDPNPNSFDCPPNSYHPLHPTYESYSYDSYGNNSQFGYYCQPQFPLNYESEPGYNENYISYPYDSSSLSQQYLCCTRCGGLHEPCQYDQLIFDEPYCKHYGGPHMNYQCQPMNQDSYNSNSLGFDQPQPPQSPVIHQPPQELSIQEMVDLKQQYLDELKHLSNLKYRDEIKITELTKNFNDMSIEIRKKEKLLQQEQWAYLNTHPSKRLHSFCLDDDDDEDYTSAITPDEPALSTEEPDNSLNDDSFSIDDIDYVEASPSDSKLVSSEVIEIVILEVEPNSRDFTKDVVEDISPIKEPKVLNTLPTHPTLQLNM